MNFRPLAALLLLSPGLVPVLRAEGPAMAPIWKLSDEDSTVYLAGSVHLLREKDLPLPAAFDRVYEASAEIVFEIDMAKMTDPATALEIARLGALPAGETLEERLGPDTMGRLRDYLAVNGRRPELFDRMAPGMAFLMLSSLEASRHGAKPELGLESTYFAKSASDSKPSRGLETVAYQVSRLNELEADTLDKIINATLDSVEEGAEALDTLTEAWRKGDAEGLDDFLRQQGAFPDEIREILLTERNRNWIPEIEAALATDRDVMFLVGAAHLVGECSVVALLRERGYKVTQLANAE
jgi:uncharacterized protein YbaP (TraB family)